MMTVPPHHHGGPAGEEGQDEAAAAVERRAEDGAERVARAERGVHQRVHAARAAGEAARENISDEQKIIVRYATLREAARAWQSRAWPRPPPPAAAACRPSPGSSPTTDQLLLELSTNIREFDSMYLISPHPVLYESEEAEGESRDADQPQPSPEHQGEAAPETRVMIHVTSHVSRVTLGDEPRHQGRGEC